MLKYEIIETPFGGEILKRTDENGQEWFIPTDPANSDYQAYLKSLEAAQSTPIVTEDE
jgi:hypothetical protein